MLKDIYIIGSGGFAKEVTFLIESINKLNPTWNIIGYIDKKEKIGEKNGKYSVVASDEDLLNSTTMMSIAIGIGNPEMIKIIIEKLKINKKLSFPNLIHPNFVGDMAGINMGEGNIITSSNIFTTDIKIGSFNIFNLCCTLGHDAVIGDYNIFNPTVNLSGGINIGECNLIGTGAQVLQYLKINNKIVVGAGSVVTKSLIESGTYVGIPAKPLRLNK